MSKKLIILIFIVLGLNANSQAEDDKKSLMLYSQFGEFCTMCEATIICSLEEDKMNSSNLDKGTYMLFHFKTRSFWSQISTIWEFFIRNFDGQEITGHSRPVQSYLSKDGIWSKMDIENAEISINPDIIKLGSIIINRKTKNWTHHNQLGMSYCERLPLWETLSYIEKRKKNIKINSE